MKRACVLSAFMTLALLVLIAGLAFAEDGKAQRQSSQCLQQQIHDFISHADIPYASSNNVVLDITDYANRGYALIPTMLLFPAPAKPPLQYKPRGPVCSSLRG